MPANPIATPSFSTTAYNYIPLLLDGDDVVSDKGTAAAGISGNLLLRGQVVKWDPATGAITVPAAATDCNAIVVNDTDTTAAVASVPVYKAGSFNAAAIVWPALSHALGTDNLRDLNILIHRALYTHRTLVKSSPTAEEEAEAKARLDAARAAAAAAAAAPAPPADTTAPKPSDAPWAYLTPEERALHPELADAPPVPPATTTP